MVDEGETKVQRAKSKVAGGITNSFKRILERAGIGKWGSPIHYTSTDGLDLVPTKEFEGYKKVLESKLKTLMGADAIEGYYPKIEDMTSKIRELYEKLQENYSEKVCDRRRSLYAGGTSNITAGQGDTVILNVFNQNRTIKIPESKEVRFPDGSRKMVSHYGMTKVEAWNKEYQDLLDTILADAERFYTAQVAGKSDTVKKNMVTQLNSFGIKCKNILEAMIVPEGGVLDLGFDTIHEGDKKGQGRFSQLNQTENATVDRLRTEIMGMLPQGPVDFFYNRTYKIVMPYYWDGNKYVDLDKAQLPVRRDLGEFEVGKDEYGMPFEVADDQYYFDGDKINEGTVLIDVFEKEPGSGNPNITFSGSPRRIRRVVPKEFIGEIPLLELVSYVLNEWDETRDDWRDGRFHHNSLTITDYLMASASALGKEWTTKLNPLKIKDEDREYKMKDLGAPWNDFTNKRKSSDLNPAFDLRSIELKSVKEKIKFLHFGKKRYYQTWEYLERTYPGNPNKTREYNIEQAKKYDPVVTTRGLSMFIIDQICRRGKTLSEIHRDLLKVSEDTGGFDYGPRSFGAPLNKDPFNIDFANVNAKVNELRAKAAKMGPSTPD